MRCKFFITNQQNILLEDKKSTNSSRKNTIFCCMHEAVHTAWKNLRIFLAIQLIRTQSLMTRSNPRSGLGHVRHLISFVSIYHHKFYNIFYSKQRT